jgi:hypothetical protein
LARSTSTARNAPRVGASNVASTSSTPWASSTCPGPALRPSELGAARLARRERYERLAEQRLRADDGPRVGGQRRVARLELDLRRSSAAPARVTAVHPARPSRRRCRTSAFGKSCAPPRRTGT